MKTIGYKEIQIGFGIQKWKVRQWIKKKLVEAPETQANLGGRAADGSYRIRQFSRGDLIDIKCIDNLYSQGFRVGKIKRIIKFIRSRQYRLEQDLYQTDGFSIWPRESIDESENLDLSDQPGKTVFLHWKELTNQVDKIV